MKGLSHTKILSMLRINLSAFSNTHTSSSLSFSSHTHFPLSLSLSADTYKIVLKGRGHTHIKKCLAHTSSLKNMECISRYWYNESEASSLEWALASIAKIPNSTTLILAIAPKCHLCETDLWCLHKGWKKIAYHCQNCHVHVYEWQTEWKSQYMYL